MTFPATNDSNEPFDADAMIEKYKRALADLENLRKRKARDVEQAVDQAEARVATHFLGIVDDFHRALQSMETASGRNAKQSILDGVRLLFEKFIHTLKQLEIEGFRSEGQTFTAELMEAIAQVPSRTLPPGTVATEISQGFTRRGKLLRPAQVAVAVKDSDDGDAK